MDQDNDDDEEDELMSRKRGTKQAAGGEVDIPWVRHEDGKTIESE